MGSVVRIPGSPGLSGKRTDAELSTRRHLIGEGLEGASFRPLLDDPARPWKKAAFSQYPRSVYGVGPCMGYTIRTDRYRLVEWAVPAKDFREYELYDHQTDPGENVNLAGRPEHAELVKELSGMLKAGWRAAGPPAR